MKCLCLAEHLCGTCNPLLRLDPDSCSRIERLRINIIETKSWLSSYINLLPYCVKRKPLKQNAFQIGTFGREVTTRPSWLAGSRKGPALPLYPSAAVQQLALELGAGAAGPGYVASAVRIHKEVGHASWDRSLDVASRPPA